MRPSAAWVVACPPGVRPRSVGTSGTACGGDRSGGAAGRRSSRHSAAAAEVGGEAGPTGRRSSADLLGELAALVRGQQRRVVLRVALGGQAVALDGVGEDHGRAGVVDARRTPRAARRGRGRRGCGWRRAGWRRRASATSSAERRRPSRRAAVRAAGRGCSAAGAGTRGSPSRRCGRRSASPPGRANSSSSSRPYLTVSTCQPAASNMPCEPGGADVGHDPVEGLPVEVDDPARPRRARRPSGRGRPPSTAPSSSSASPTSEYCRPVPPCRRAST